MNEQAQKVLADLLQKASNGIDSAVSFSQAQIPDVIHQLLTWSLVSSLIGFSIGLLIISLGVSIPFIAKSARKRNATWTFYEGRINYGISSCLYDFSFHLIPLPTILVGLLISLSNMTWLKIILAPKLYLIEYGASLIK